MASIRLIRSTDRRSRRRLALTPLIDVVFLLLVFFILAGRFESHNHLTLSEPSAATALTAAPPPMVLRLLPDGSVQLRGQTLATEDLRTRFIEADFPPVILAPRPEVDVQMLVSWVDRLEEFGIDQVQFLGAPRP